jgi:predicted O-methyltransferase YrrM
MEDLWSAVDRYFAERIAHDDDALKRALADSEAAALPPISVTPADGKLLHLLARIIGAKRILEIGTLGGYSAIWMARALPKDGELISLEINPEYAKLARKNIDRAGIGDRVEIMVGPAADTLDMELVGKCEPFDLVFIDADKANNDRYFKSALKLTKRRSVIVVDNVVRKGEVINAKSTDENIQGVRRMVDYVANESRVSATALQTVGAKGYDGFLMAMVVK